MSFADCLSEAGRKKLLSKDKQTSLTTDFEDLKKNYQFNKGMSEDEAARKAGIELFNQMKVDAAQKIKIKKMTLDFQKQFESRHKEYLKQSGKNYNIGDFLESHTHKITLPQNVINNISVEARIEAIEGIFVTHMDSILTTFQRNVLGVNKQKATFEALGREIFQPNSTNNMLARELATAWRNTSEFGRRLYNNSGGRIPYNENWHLPQSHNSYLIHEFGKKEWVDYLFNENIIDLDKMINYQTGRVFGREELRNVLSEVWETIRTNGRTKQGNVKSAFPTSLANKRIDHRFIQFKDFDAWQKYMNKFGTEMNVFDLMISHLQSMARDIGTMQTLTPNPERMISWMEQFALKHMDENPSLYVGKSKKKFESQIKNAVDNMKIGMHIINGGHNQMNTNIFGTSMAGLRDMTNAAYLGSAVVLATGDFNLTRQAARYIGLPQFKTMTGNMKVFAEAAKKDKKLMKTAMTSGLTAELMTNVMSSAARYNVGETASPNATKRVSDFVMRASGLSWLTQAGKWGAGLEMMGYMASVSDLSWKELAKENKKFFDYLKTFSITESDWTKFKSIKKYNPNDTEFPGAEYLRPADLLNSDLPEELAMDIYIKFQAATNSFLDFSVPTAKIKSQLFLGYSKPGTVGGELKRSIVQFKQFPLVFHYQQIKRIMGMSDSKQKLIAATDMLLSTTLMGAFAYEMKQIIKGKKTTDITDMTKGEFTLYIANQMMHGGGLGFIGDLIQQFKYGADIPAGASLGLVGDVTNLTLGNIERYLRGDDPNVRGQIYELIKKNFPGSSLWYARLALERIGFDWLQEIVDPKYPQKRKRLNKRVKDQNTEYWWSPGERTPSERPF
jgi:hypothetical protein